MSIIDLSRNVLVHHALNQTKADIFMWIDSDMIFDAKDVHRICERLLNSNYDVLGAICPKRASLQPVAGCPLKMGRHEFWNAEKSDLLDAEHVGMAFTAVKRTAYETLAGQLRKVSFPAIGEGTPFYMPIIRNGCYQPEDVTFCTHIKEGGMKIGIDPLPRVWHRGSYDYGLEDSSQAVQRFPTIILDFIKETAE